MQRKFDQTLSNFMPLLAPLSVLAGVVFATPLTSAVFLVPWIFAAITLVGSLSSNFTDLKQVLRHPLPLFVCFAVLHVVTPLIAWGAGKLMFPNDALTVTGIVLVFVIPTGVMSFLWVSMFKGNIALTLSLILLDTLLSPIIVPLSLEWLVGAEVAIDLAAMMQGLLWMIVLPSLLGMAFNQFARQSAVKKWRQRLSPFSKLMLCTVIMLNGSVVAPYFRMLDLHLLGVIGAMFVLANIGYLCGWLAAKLFRWERGTTIALTMNGGMRNISAGAVLAMSYFPPAVTLPVVACMLFQQVLASLYTAVIRLKYGFGEAGGSTIQQKIGG